MYTYIYTYLYMHVYHTFKWMDGIDKIYIAVTCVGIAASDI